MKCKTLFLALPLLLAACREKEQVDIKPPVVEYLSLNDANDTHYTFAAGSTFTINFKVQDNKALNSIAANLHPASDGHYHNNGSVGGEYHLPSGEWHWQMSGFTSADTYLGQAQLTIPDSIAGTWHLEVKAIDKVGLSVSKAISIEVTNSNLPEIAIVSCNPEISSDGYIHVNQGGSVTINASATDNDLLAAVSYRLVSQSGNLLGEHNVPVFGNTVSFPATLTNAQPGEYRLIIDAVDLLGYHSVWDVRIKVQ